MLITLTAKPAASSGTEEVASMCPQNATETINITCSKMNATAIGHASFTMATASARHHPRGRHFRLRWSEALLTESAIFAIDYAIARVTQCNLYSMIASYSTAQQHAVRVRGLESCNPNAHVYSVQCVGGGVCCRSLRPLRWWHPGGTTYRQIQGWQTIDCHAEHHWVKVALYVGSHFIVTSSPKVTLCLHMSCESHGKQM